MGKLFFFCVCNEIFWQCQCERFFKLIATTLLHINQTFDRKPNRSISKHFGIEKKHRNCERKNIKAISISGFDILLPSVVSTNKRSQAKVYTVYFGIGSV